MRPCTCLALVLVAALATGGTASHLRLLAFGDSLTAGCCTVPREVNEMEYHVRRPYTTKLLELIRARAPNTEILNRGVSGERVLGGMVERLERVLANATAERHRYHWVLILAGINDLGGFTNSPVDEILQGLTRMYRSASAHGARVLAMTCMGLAASSTPEYARNEAERVKLNGLIREHAASTAKRAPDATASAAADSAASGGGPPGAAPIVLLDLEKLLPYSKDSTLFSDGLHLTVLGYEKMGTLVFEALAPELQLPSTT